MPEVLMKFLVQAGILVVVFYSIIIHEVSHAWVASWLGDDTAQRQGRLSLNPIKHIDIFGTVVLPLLLYFSAGFIFGYAKPVPINPYNFKNYKRDSGLTALAGPISNICIAVLFTFVYHMGSGVMLLPQLALMVVYLNLLLAFFNLIPVPPLDGSKVLGIFLSDRAYYQWPLQEKKGMIILIGVILVSNLFGLNLIGRLVMPVVRSIMQIWGLL
ncbi:MAG TPA: site-2 protease family protein [Candidatus Cloacimonadota bacterium]|nr:site-2 protease family protein [Candidatus Cloacimonadota bacterium]